MSPLLDTAVVGILAFLTMAGAAYSLAVGWAAQLFLRENRRGPAPDETPFTPPVSVLKPLCGTDPELLDNLRSHARQDYPGFELIFGVAEAGDPALEAVDQLRHEFPGMRIEARVCGRAAGGNPKAAILAAIKPLARHEIAVVSDADIRVGPQFLRHMAAPLADPGVGVVTCLYRANPAQTWASRLDALWVSAEFPGQVLLARKLQGVRFALGAGIAFRRSDLRRIGGFEAIQPYLADDYQLGARVAALNRRIVLSPEPVQTVLRDAGGREVWRRHLRWSRTVRASRPKGHLGLIFTFGSVWAVMLVLLSGASTPWAWLAAAALAARCAAVWFVAARVLRAGAAVWAWLTPLLDLWSLAIWIVSHFGGSVYWRGRNLFLDGSGRIIGDK